jgi:hypothetical protein
MERHGILISSERICYNTNVGSFILLGIIIGAIITNLAQFLFIESQIGGPNYPAINSYGTSNLAEISRSKAGPTSEANNSFYLTLSVIAPGAVIIIPNDSSLCVESFYGLGRAGSVEELDYDPEKYLADLKIDEHVVERYEPQLEHVKRAPELKPVPGPFAFALGDDRPKILIALRREGLWVFTDTALLPTEEIKELYH